jgi:hypothetical protein
MKTRLLSLLVAVVLAATIVPANLAFAQEHGSPEPTTSSSPRWSDVKEVAIWSMAGISVAAAALGVLYLFKRKIGAFPENPSWVAPISIMPASQLPGDDNQGHEAVPQDSHAPAH